MDKKRFGQFIKERRLAKGLTQAEVAQQLYLDVTAVSKWERGVNLPDISMISGICKCLDITEHELIESSEDSEFRQAMYNSKQYVKGKKIAFWSVNACYLVAILTCFIVELAVSHRLSWFFIVLTSCACGYWGTMYPVLFRILKKHISENTARYLSKFGLLIYSSGLLALTLAILFSTNAYRSFDIIFAVQTTVYSFLILFLYGTVELLPITRLSKLGIDSLLTGGFTITYGKVLPALMHVPEENYEVNFLDWAGYTSGNVVAIILSTFAVLGVVLIVLGIKNRPHS